MKNNTPALVTLSSKNKQKGRSDALNFLQSITGHGGRIDQNDNYLEKKAKNKKVTIDGHITPQLGEICMINMH